MILDKTKSFLIQINEQPQNNGGKPVEEIISDEDAWWEKINLENFLQELSMEKNVFAARGIFLVAAIHS